MNADHGDQMSNYGVKHQPDRTNVLLRQISSRPFTGNGHLNPGWSSNWSVPPQKKNALKYWGFLEWQSFSQMYGLLRFI